tara:strand:+ start:3554 stop:3745 length:192 start_codon:yes stop_codon:yes gene_type:complete
VTAPLNLAFVFIVSLTQTGLFRLAWKVLDIPWIVPRIPTLTFAHDFSFREKLAQRVQIKRSND